MATDGKMASRAGVQVGETYQTATGGHVAIWMRMDAGDISETSTSISFSVGGAFAYTGYDNFVPMRAGYIAFKSDGTVYTDGAAQTYFNCTTQAQMGSDMEYYARFTVTKPKYMISICPYLQVGTINAWSDGGSFGNGNMLWGWGSDPGDGRGDRGIMQMYSTTNAIYNSNYWDYVSPVTSKRGNLQCFGRYGSSGSDSLSYASGYKVSGQPVIYVYNSSGKPIGTSKIYIYNSNGAPRQAKSITVYDSSGKPHTTQLS